VIALAGVVKQGPFVDIDEVQIYIFVVDQSLKYFYLFQGLGSDPVLHFAEAVEDRGSIVFVKSIYFAAMLKQNIQQLQGRVKASRVEDQMMERVSLVHVLKVRIHSYTKQMLDLSDCVILVPFDDFD
jgi:hypothetical protein